MCAGTTNDYLYAPKWLKDNGCPGFEYQYNGAGPKHWVPDMDSRQFQEAHFRLITELGKRYDGNPDLDLIDIGSVGLWGEWHMSGTGVKMPSKETRLALIDCYRHAFPKTPKVMLIGDEPGLRYAVQHGCGWRADCLGDMGGFSKTWNHMENFYKQQLKRAAAGQAWKKAPVAFESCWDMRKWVKEKWSLRYIFNYALDLHASCLNNKSAPLPPGEDVRSEIKRFLRRLGYRFVLSRLEYPARVGIGRPFPVRMIWRNIGSAPCYRPYRVAFRLTGPRGRRHVFVTNITVEKWMPGSVPLFTEEFFKAPPDLPEGAPVKIETTIGLPEDLPAGEYDLGLAVVGSDDAPVLHLGIKGREKDGWYEMGRLRLVRE
jgi:hypothetical protein